LYHNAKYSRYHNAKYSRYYNAKYLRYHEKYYRPYRYVMESPCDSDASEGMQDLVRRGFAIRRDRKIDQIGDAHVQFHDMDVSHLQCPLALNLPAGVAPTHGLTAVTQELATARGRNTGTTEAGFGAVGETRSTTRGGTRRPDVRASSNEEMLNA